MPGHKESQNRNDINSGEDFSEVSSTLDSDEESVAQDQWIFPVVPRHAKHEDYETACPFSTVYYNRLIGITGP
jgi:hypothetical protein